MKKVKIIHTNDIHSKYEEFLHMSYIIENEKDENTLLLDAGDFNDFSSFITYGTKGYAGLKMLNILGYEALCIGNNEGFQNIEIIEEMAGYNLINILSCNLLKIDGTYLKNVREFLIKEINGIKFLIIGVSPYLPSYNLYYNLYGLTAIKPFGKIKKLIKENKGKYNFIILLSHLGLEGDIMMSQSIKEIDIIISGHSHHTLNCIKVNNTYIQQAGVRGSNVGVLNLMIENDKIVDINGKNIATFAEKNISERIKKEYERQIKLAQRRLNQPFLNVYEDLKYSIDEECNISNLITDYLFNKYECDFSLINSGVTASNVKKGQISYLDILKLCNSPLKITSFEIKGKYILKSIISSNSKEKCYDNRRRAGFRGTFLGKLHCSYNIKIVKNKNEINIYIDNKLIENEKYYKIVTTDYFYRGMGYSSFKKNRNGKLYRESIQEAIINALKDKNNYKYINRFRWE